MTCWRLLLGVFGSRILLSLVGGTLLIVMADVAETSRQLAEQDDPFSLLLRVYGNLTPSLALQALPVAVLLGVLLSVTDLARSRELLALRAAGAGSVRLASPALIIAASLAMGGVVIADHVAPPGVKRATSIQMEELGRMRSSWRPFQREHRWFAAEGGGLYHVAEVSEDGRVLRPLWRYDYAGGRLTSVVHMDEVEHDGDRWNAENVTGWHLDGDDESTLILDDRIPSIEDPAHFAGVGGHPEAMTRRELREAISLQRARGRTALPFEIEAQARWTMPLLGLALAVVALGLGLARPPATHVEAAAIAIGVAFGAWTLLAACRAMGLAGMLSPTIAAFLPVLFPAAAGLLLLQRWR